MKSLAFSTEPLSAAELADYYHSCFLEKVKDDFVFHSFDEVWPELDDDDLKKAPHLTGWKRDALISLRNTAKKLMDSTTIGREEQTAGLYFLASELALHPNYTFNAFTDTLNSWENNAFFSLSYDTCDALSKDLFRYSELYGALVSQSAYVSKHEGAFENSAEDLKALILKSQAISKYELLPDQLGIAKFSQEVFGLDTKFFRGLDELHGRYDAHDNAIYVNADTKADIEWAFWHAAFHALKHIEPRLYDDILYFTEREHMFTRREMVQYRLDIKQPHMSDAAIYEEMLADAFADLKTNRRPIIRLAEKKTGIASRLIRFAKSALHCIEKVAFDDDLNGPVLPSPDHEVYPKIRLDDDQFRDFAEFIEEVSRRVLAMDIPKSFQKKAYNILTGDGSSLTTKMMIENLRVYCPELYGKINQKNFDIDFSRIAPATYENISKAIMQHSPNAVGKPSYARNIASMRRNDKAICR